MTTPISAMSPFYTPMVRMMAMQTRFAIETSQSMMKLAMMPWAGLPAGFGSICTPMGSVTVKTTVSEAAPAAKAPAKTARVAEPETVEATAVEVKEPANAPAGTGAPAEPVAKPEAAPKAEAKPEAAPKAESAPAPKAEVKPAAAPEAKPAPEPAAASAPGSEAPGMLKPAALKAPKGEADDLTALNGVGPKLAEALHAEGIYHYAQIAAWDDANVAWADENLPGVRGSASRNGWVAQAADLAK